MHTFLLGSCFTGLLLAMPILSFVFFPRGGSYGLLSAIAIPLDLPNRNVYMAFNFESNYGLPSNDSYNEWIDRWNLDQNFLSAIGNNITPINGRNDGDAKAHKLQATRSKFYRSVVNYLMLFGMNGTACLLRTICEVRAYNLDESNGVLGSILKVLFIPTASQPEQQIESSAHSRQLHEAALGGNNDDVHDDYDCGKYHAGCPHGIVDMITTTLF